MSMWNPFARKPGKPGEPILAVATFVIGIGVMAIEITASRLLAPYFGASMFVWTSLIVTVLVALSVGYYIGGKMAANGAGLDLVGYLSFGAALFLMFGTLIIPSFSSAISGMLVRLSSASIALFLGSLLVTMLVFAAPVFLMALAGPIILKAWSALGDVGAMSGRYFAISTIGSVIGTVAPTLLLVPTIGSRGTVYVVAGMFLALGIGLASGWRKSSAIFVLALVIIPSVLPPRVPGDVVLQRESPYQLIRVAQAEEKRYLIFNEGSGVQSVFVPGRGRTGFYFDYLGIMPFLRPSSDGVRHRALIIGLAGGTAAVRYASFLPDGQTVDLTGVEVDPAVIDAARQWFDLDATGVKIENADGRTFLMHGAGIYDSILVDAYSTQLYIPPHLATKEFFALAKEHLVPGGVFAMNVNAPNDDSRLLQALVNTLAAVYRNVLYVPVADTWNYLVLASDGPIDLPAVAQRVPRGFEDVQQAMYIARTATFDPEKEVFTDDRAPVEFLTDSMILEQAVRRP